ncbi:MAG: ABC transporter permease [Hungatella sp.]|jgi:putative ABC transport system permease protein|nr:ABC transporter permease [Hungatella sp.]
MEIRSILKRSVHSLKRNKGSYVACVLVLTLGVLVFVSILSVLGQIRKGINQYYEETNFGDGFAEVIAMPSTDLNQLKALPGISAAEGVLSKEVRVDFTDSTDLITIKLIGVGTDKFINQYQFEGSELRNDNDIWINESFMKAHNLLPGDSLPLILNGVKKDFTVKGTVKSPEYITIMPGDAQVPDERTFGIGFLQIKTMENYFDYQGQVNEISFLLADGYQYEDVKYVLEEMLKKYGILSMVARKDQPSNFYISDEIDSLMAIGTVLPVLFLTITAIMVFIMLKRFIEQERTEIGTFKAYGYTSIEITTGYLLFGFLIGLAGFLLGIIPAVPFGKFLYDFYKDIYTLPDVSFYLSSDIVLLGLIIALTISIASAIAGSKTILHILPAEAIRSKAPAAGGDQLKLNAPFYNLVFDMTGIMALRSIMRNKTRSAMVVFSVIIAFSLINVLFALGQATEKTIVDQADNVEIFDIKMTLKQAYPENHLVREVELMDGVISAEGLLTMPVQLRNKSKKEDLLIYGVKPGSLAYKIKGTDNKYYSPSGGGIILNRFNADKLQLSQGDLVEIYSPYLKSPVTVTVNDIIEEAIGPGCYMEQETLSKIYYSKQMSNIVLIRAKQEVIPQLQKKLAQYPNISGLANQKRNLEVNKETVETVLTLIYAFIFMAFLMGFGAIYNVSRISLEEKKRELATMRVLGYTIDETAATHTFEQWLMLFIGVIVGFIPAIFLKDYLSGVFSSESLVLKADFTMESTLVALACCFMAVLLSNYSARKEVKRYDMVEVLRERE